ncbi:adenylate/guanylate cyclase domain-containing protein [Actinomadura logoneensis]|uniref:adenylate/guanylate cyclase domain-containing protein n=1 Tax=Actinomadura logoneensis TaxID=2293572 RepID=UPI002E275312
MARWSRGRSPGRAGDRGDPARRPPQVHPDGGRGARRDAAGEGPADLADARLPRPVRRRGGVHRGRRPGAGRDRAARRRRTGGRGGDAPARPRRRPDDGPAGELGHRRLAAAGRRPPAAGRGPGPGDRAGRPDRHGPDAAPVRGTAAARLAPPARRRRAARHGRGRRRVRGDGARRHPPRRRLRRHRLVHLAQPPDAGPALAEFVERFESFTAETVAELGGRIVKTLGDEAFFVAPDPRAVAEIGLRLAERHTADPDFPVVRVGLAYGEVVLRLGDVFGTPVNLAARLTAAAHRGTILIDTSLASGLADAGYAISPLRPRHLQGLGRTRPHRLRRS